jgi:phosphoglycerate kinase
MSLPALADLRELDGARVLLRLDLNVPVKNGAVQDATRIEASLPTLRWLLERVSVVAACSHLGDAKGKPDPALSLAPVAAALERALGRPVGFVADSLDPAAGKAAPGSLLLLENLRFHKGEKANDPEFAKQLAAPFSHYVNDAFGAAHRAHASVAAAPALFAPGRKAAGLLMGTEVAALYRMVHEPEQPYVAVVGGAKISTKTAPLAALLERVELLLIGGGMANTMLLAQGRPVGRSLVEQEMLETAASVLRRAAERGVSIELPTDVVVADAIASPTRVEVVAADAVPAGMMIVDIGPATQQRFAAAIAGARTVFWNGPMGVFETAEFAAGTMAVARALAGSKAFTVVGGGESVMAVHRAGVAGAIGHVSTGGGASLEFITGKVLPAIAALEA